MSTVRERGVMDMLELSTINRWAIVDMFRPQSVADHTYRVWVLVQDLYEVMEDLNHNTFEKESTMMWAMIHDVEEVYTGDIPSVLKDILEKLSPGITTKLKEHVLAEKLPTVATRMRGIKGTLPDYYVKIADCVEAVLYARRYCTDLNRKAEVINYLDTKLEQVVEDVEKRYRSIPWDRCREWIRQVLDHEPPVMARGRMAHY